MVGHTGNFRAATMAIEAVDLALARCWRPSMPPAASR
jgi:bisphosphoglycerate-independent phosphoglycerate mutase (AlkP superfamily)